MIDAHAFVDTFQVEAGEPLRFVSLQRVQRQHPRVARFPATVRVLLEAALRRLVSDASHAEAVASLLAWWPGMRAEIPVWVSRVLLQDASGVPLLGDFAAMRTAAARAGVAAEAIRPSLPIDLVIDHSVVAAAYGDAAAQALNLEQEYRLNDERFSFVKWAAQAFDRLRVVPPGNGIVHQINLEYFAGVIARADGFVFPDSVVGTDSHTTMINGLGVLGWGVGGLEAEIALLGEPLYQGAPEVVAVRLDGRLAAGVRATDAALHLTHALREFGVVGKFIEFVGPGARALAVEDRATIANMAPEYGSTTGYFGVDEATLAYLRRTGRAAEWVEQVRRYYTIQDLFGIPDETQHDYSSVFAVDLSRVGVTVAGPSRPQQKLSLAALPPSLGGARPAAGATGGGPQHGAVVLAAITSCTNTANPSAMLAAGLLARNAVARGLKPAPYVKTVLAPGSRALTRYLERAGLLAPLQQLGFFVAAYGCASCVGNTGALAPGVEQAVRDGELTVAAVLSGNRNFEGRIHPAIRANYLASPELVVAFALAGSVLRDLDTEPLGQDATGRRVYLAELRAGADEVAALAEALVDRQAYLGLYDASQPEGADERWRGVRAQSGPVFRWDERSSYFVEPPFFHAPARETALGAIDAARVLGVFGDAVTTDHISPVGEIAVQGVAGAYLQASGVAPADFNTYGARRCNHHVMMRGTFSNPRLVNAITGGSTARSARSGAPGSFYDVALENIEDGVPSVVIAGKAYGSGSARDWAARGTALLGVAAVVARSFERIHRSNLVLLGVLPVELDEGVALDGIAWRGTERVAIEFDARADTPRPRALVVVSRDAVVLARAPATLRVDTAAEWRYLRGGGVLRTVFERQLAVARASAATPTLAAG
ncbi:Aconitate hydratase A [Burkholderia glumae]|uniref:aconitate hydratase n=1 Tax=Burkholderia glumae TaxID=337 RepID=UPI001373EDAD|nr:aconitate hydratase AcnA [Burkholderia glumae]MCR1770355.1 aconitate hydratase AcnA [Burkholderia glumae]QHP93165.1 aconitate hydratase AcnA [Burkholderia glumae]QKM50758.1 Aconitate hydratase A [Burkholderia glumae]